MADPGLNGGAAFGDYTADGWPDLLVTQTCPGEIEALIYQNAGDGRFERQFGMLAESGRALGALFVDLESDGDLDVLAAFGARQFWCGGSRLRQRGIYVESWNGRDDRGNNLASRV